MGYQVLSTGRQTGRGGAKWTLVFLAVFVLATLLGQAGNPARANMSAASLLPPPNVAPQNGALFGAYVKPFNGGWLQADWKAAMNKREADLGRNLDINHHYSGWTKPFPDWQLDWDASEGRISMVSLDGPTTMGSINNGSQDAQINAHADAVKAFGKPVFIRWLWEMDTRKAQIESPEAFVAAWRRLHEKFDARGATNALWTWCPTAWSFTTGAAQDYYPGDAYVDWICTDGYNWAPGRPDAVWRSFKDIFKDFYAWGAARNKPLMVGETGTEERNPGEKASWFSNIVSAMKAYPKMKALVYFDTATTDLAGTFYHWRPDTSTSAYNAYIGMAGDPYLNQDLVEPPVDPPPTEPVPTEPPPTEPPPTEPPPPPVERTLSVSVEGPGTVSGGDLNCTAVCTKVVLDGTDVTLTATPQIAGGFQGWSGACSGTSTTCTIDVTSDASVVAKFVSKTLKGPRLTKPDKRLQGSSTITVAWTDEEPVEGGGFELRTRSASNRRLIDEATSLVQGVSGTQTIMLDGVAGKTYCFEVRAVAPDAASPWSEESCTSVPLDDTSLRRKGRWTKKSADSSFGGSYSSSRKRGARLVKHDVKAKHLAVLARSCRRCGKMKVMWNRQSLGRFDLGSRRGSRAIDVASFGSVRTGTVKIVVASKDRRVRIDGLGLSQK